VSALTAAIGLIDDGAQLHRSAEKEVNDMHESADDFTRAEALFASPLQAADVEDTEIVDRAVTDQLRRDGPRGCSARMAYEFGEHPDLAARRMRWARRVVGQSVGA
jgi:hypothetical protein